MKNAFPAVLAAVSASFLGSLALGGVVDLPRYPAISPEGSVVVFSWRGDLWKAPISGGAAVRLSSHPANEGRSAFSPDGAQIVFESDRVGGRNLFIMNSDGSGLRQLTHGDSSLTLSGTGVDGSGRPVAFVEGARENDLYRATRPYFVPLTGGNIERVHDAFGSHPVSNANGSTVLFERGGSDWARRAYQGPDNRNVWAWNRDGNSFTQLTDHPGNDGYAWFAGNDMVYLSDRGNGRSANVWRKPLTGARGDSGRQLTNFEDDVRELVVSADGKTAAFVVWDSLYRLDLSDPNAQPIKVIVTGSEDAQDLTRTRNMGREVTEAQLSPDGKTMAFVAYGDVYVKGVDERSPFVRVTSNPWRERDIAWMPDGTKLLFVSDEDGNDSIYEATVEQTRSELRKAFKDKLQPKKEEPAAPAPAPAEPAEEVKEGAKEEKADQKKDEKEDEKGDGKKEEKKDEKKDEGARWSDAVKVSVKPLIATPASERSPSPSPDGKQLAYRKELSSMVVRDLDTGEERTIREGFDMGIDWRWSPDGRYFAIEQSDDNFNSDIWVVPTDGSAPAVNVSRHPDGDGNPRWSADSKVLAFVSSRVNNESDVYMVFLDKELEGMSRFEQDQYFKDAADAAKKKASDRMAAFKKKDEKKKSKGDEPNATTPDATKPDAQKTEAPKPDAPKPDVPKPEPAKPLDLEDAYLRLRRLTSMPGNEMGLELTPAGDRVYFTAQDQGGGLFSMAWSGGEPKKLTATGAIQQMTADGSKMVLASKTGGSVVNLPGGDSKSVEFTDTVETDLAAQSRQKFLEAARIMAYQFYSPTMNGVDWPAATAKWAQLASAARTDEEFDYVANRFLGELNASHLGVRSPREGGGVVRLGTGRLAAKTRPVEGGVEVIGILKDSPLLKSVTPLAVGDVMTRINGQSITPTVTLDELLYNTVGKETIVAVKRTCANGETVELEAIIVPVSAGEQSRLAYEATQARSRELVSKLSNGRIGYIHVQSMDQPSLDDYERDLYAAAEGKDGLVIDVRNNGGGWTADRLLSSIMASPHAYTIPRGGNPERKGRYPADRLFIQRYTLPINMLANEKSFSNAEITAHAFKTLKRGTLVGQQTYGGVISTGSASLIDGTTVRTPFRGWYLPDGTDMEKHGAIPDLVVPQTPEDESAEKDAQLETAVIDLMKRLN